MSGVPTSETSDSSDFWAFYFRLPRSVKWRKFWRVTELHFYHMRCRWSCALLRQSTGIACIRRRPWAKSGTFLCSDFFLKIIVLSSTIPHECSGTVWRSFPNFCKWVVVVLTASSLLFVLLWTCGHFFEGNHIVDKWAKYTEELLNFGLKMSIRSLKSHVLIKFCVL